MKIDSSLANMISVGYINPYFPSICLCVDGGGRQAASRDTLERTRTNSGSWMCFSYHINNNKIIQK